MEFIDEIDDFTDDADEIIMERALRDTAFREGLLQEGVERLIAGEIDVGEALINDYINATAELNKRSCDSKKSSNRSSQVLGPKGKQHVNKLLAGIQYLQEQTGFQLEVKVRRPA